jgi:hypothetical protein
MGDERQETRDKGMILAGGSFCYALFIIAKIVCLTDLLKI